ncbi:hypothetical protein PG993_010496 [Apiospora rasikravindrae]|uniref:Uncharacterized protein n=1 Tax=Apiospora rasikravindrae TaxID=990691 RepID=A0ABR1SMH5_9PEZI
MEVPTFRNAIPPLLRIPLELRNLVYEYLVIIDQDFSYDVTDITFESSIFQINRQIRHEAWDYMARGHLWIRWESDLINSEVWEPRAPVLFGQSLNTYSERFDNELAIHFHLRDGHRKVTDALHSFTFAYHPSIYCWFLLYLCSCMQDLPHSRLIVEVKPEMIKRLSGFARTIEPLYCLRGLRKVSFTGMDDWDGQQALAEQMMGTGETIEAALAMRQRFQDIGRKAELEGRYSNAMIYYDLGPESKFSTPVWFPMGSPENNSLDDMDTELYIAFSRTTHKHILWLKQTAPLATLVESTTQELLLDIFRACNSALAFVGLTDIQRCKAHLYRAFGFFRYAEYVGPFLDQNSVDSLCKDDPIKRPSHVYRGDCYLLAARNLFYAQNVGAWDDVLPVLSEDDRQICSAIQARPGPRAFKLEEREIPLMGTWKGDPDLWNSWNARRMGGRGIFMKMFRRRHNDGEAGVPPDLTAAYAAHGISWSRTTGGELIPDLSGIVDTSLLPLA